MMFRHRHQKAFLLSLILLIILISSCAPTTANSTQPVITSVVPSSTTSIATNTIIPTPTILPTHTIETIPSIKIEKSCLTLEDQLPSDLNLKGVWVRQPGNPYLENFKEHSKYGIPLYGGGLLSNYQGNWAVSPNGQWLAYLDTNLDTSGRISKTTGDSLRIIHSSGYSLSMNYWPISFQKIDRWVDDQHLVLELNYFSKTDHRVVILNPFSGEWKYLSEPDWFNQVSINRRRSDSITYSPNLNEVILDLKDHSELRDIKTGALLSGDSKTGFFDNISWSNDNAMLALTTESGKVLHIVQDKTEVLRLDLLKDSLVTTTGEAVLIRNLSWSLDHHSLLLETYYESLVLDVEQSKVFVLCFTDKHIKYGWLSESFLYPESGEFLVTRITQEISPSGEQRPFEILVDIKNKRAYKLAESLYYQDRIGWLESP